jgi:hypothetical protein
VVRFAVALAAVAGLGQITGSPAHASGGRTFVLSRVSAAPGGFVGFTLQGWDGAVVEVSLCAARVSGAIRTCDASRSVLVATGAGGRATGSLRIGPPGFSCPCVARARTLDRGREVVTPFAVVGVRSPGSTAGGASIRRSAALLAQPVRIEALHVGAASWTERLGGPGRRLVDVVLVNRSDHPVIGLHLALAAGPAGRALQAASVPDLEPLPPRQRRVVTVPVDLDGPVSGDVVVEAQLSGPTMPSTSTVELTTHPWGALAVAAGVVVLLAVRTTRTRSRLASLGLDASRARPPNTKEPR